MDDTEACKVSGPLATVLRLSSAVGMAPLRLSPLRDRTEHRRMLPSLRESHSSTHCGYSVSLSRKFSTFYPALIFALCLSQMLASIYVKYVDTSKVSLTILPFTISRVVIEISLATATFDGMKRMKRFISYLNKIEEINEGMNSNHLNLKVKKSSVVLWGFLTAILFICSWYLFFIIKTLLDSEWETFNIIKVLSQLGYIIKQILQLLVLMQFVFIVCAVNDTLRVLNDKLRNLIYNLQLLDSIKTNACIRVRHLCRTHMEIRGLVKSIDGGEGALVFLVLVNQTVDLMNWLYYFMSSYSYIVNRPYYEVLRYCSLIFWCLYKGASLILLVEPCHKTQQQFQNSQNLISRLMCASSEREFRDELSRYHDQFTCDAPVFSPLGMCVLTRQLVVVIIGSLTTVLSIILQFNIK